jgi:hypothetical protein
VEDAGVLPARRVAALEGGRMYVPIAAPQMVGVHRLEAGGGEGIVVVQSEEGREEGVARLQDKVPLTPDRGNDKIR